MASMLSFLICVALPAAISGAPTALISMSGCPASVLSMASCTITATLAFIADSLVPNGDVRKAMPLPSFRNM